MCSLHVINCLALELMPHLLVQNTRHLNGLMKVLLFWGVSWIFMCTSHIYCLSGLTVSIKISKWCCWAFVSVLRVTVAKAVLSCLWHTVTLVCCMLVTVCDTQ